MEVFHATALSFSAVLRSSSRLVGEIPPVPRGVQLLWVVNVLFWMAHTVSH